MRSQASHLPSRFPVGTRYVIEGRGGDKGQLRVHSRFIAFPDGRTVTLPADLAERAAFRPVSRRRRRKAR
jgi:hypothetical protein